MQKEDTIYDVIIIGGGPAGLTAAQYSARAGLRTVVIDKSSSASALSYARIIENYPGVGAISGKELLDKFREQAIDFGAEYHEKQVIGVRLEDEVKEVYTMDDTYKGKAVIIATGSMGRKPTIKGEKEFLGRGVSYCAVCDAAFFKGRVVSVLGDSEEALKEAHYLTKFAERVYLVSPFRELKVADISHYMSENLKIMKGYSVTAIEGSETVERIILKDIEGNQSTLDVSGVFVYLHGSRPVVDFLQGTLELSDDECVMTNKMMETSIPGVFAAGDVTCTEVRQVVIAAAHGCIAALSAEKYITHKKRRRYDWSK